MTVPNRAAAAAVFAAATDLDDEGAWASIIGSGGVAILPDGVDSSRPRQGGHGPTWKWRYHDPAQVAEALETLRLAPPADGFRTWPCGTCRRLGDAPSPIHVTCSTCGGCGRAAAAPDVQSLVRVALIGVGAWLRAEQLARCAGASAAMWCPAPAPALEQHHRRMSRRRVSTEWSLAAFFSRHLAGRDPPTELPESPPARGRRGRSAAAGMLGDGVWSSGDERHAVASVSASFARAHGAWPSMLELARCGVHLVADGGWWEGETPWVALCPSALP